METQFGKLFGRDIHRLQKGEWLNDELINYYFLMVHERSLNPTKLRKSDSKPLRTKLPKTFAFNTFFYSLLCSRGYAGVKRWTKKRRVNLFECERILVPINKGGYHWILAMVNVTERRIEYYDSMGREGVSSENQGVLTNVRNFLVEEAKTQNISPEAVAQWTFYVPVFSSLLPLPPTLPLPPPFILLGLFFPGQELIVENAQAEEWLGLWGFHVYYC